jgi:hypothetical protein
MVREYAGQSRLISREANDAGDSVSRAKVGQGVHHAATVAGKCEEREITIPRRGCHARDGCDFEVS